MKRRRTIILAGAATLVILVGVVIYLFAPPGHSVKVNGPLTAQDVVEIKRFVFRERVSLVRGSYGTYRLSAPAADKVRQFLRNLREHAAGKLDSIATTDGQAVVVDYGDRWNGSIRYSYFLQRTPAGWKIAGVVICGPALKLDR